ncbi:CheD [Desulforamulus reducens MI-1]|uniref:Probable chemoreceptor glutamine deamidase CheD n=1 Tax=Desulforamulus reducens (strain ATCC BAA-1160 / DSM 100696 / MI-1) TaxID=349161 RepID=CHED_DESRM|nr:chemotaxis protein CheD [Desulforamulus reducens]A4J742.1 RecName: Full=Probable chemoreceptor glutamine deamidase CheD [Desulforamulus reducens MI-1]ABO50895.1 CheD [Desulforamulus reducens MI-1]
MELAKGNAEIQVGIADYKVAASPNRLITLGLGSCVGVVLYDPVKKVGGLLHIMLPDSTQFNNVTKPAKFADTGIPLMIDEIKRLGGIPSRLTAKLAGGAQMFSGLDEKFVLNIGQRNSKMVKEILSRMGIRILAEELGGNRGRTMIFDIASGQVTIRTIGSPLKVI